MSSITFELSNPCFQYNSSIDEDSIHINVSGKCLKPWHKKYFTVFKGESKWDAFGSHASINLIQRVARTEKLGVSTEAPINSADGHRDVVSVAVYANEVSFSISLALPPDAYRRLKDTNWSIEKVELTISNGLFGHSSEAFTSGPDPDGHEIEWHIDRQEYQFIEDFYIRFLPIPHEDLEFPKINNILNEKIDQYINYIESKHDHLVQNVSSGNLAIYEFSAKIFRWLLVVVFLIFISTAFILALGNF